MTIGQSELIHLLGPALSSASDKENIFLGSMYRRYLRHQEGKEEDISNIQHKYLKDIREKYPEEIAARKAKRAYGNIIQGKQMDGYEFVIGSNVCCRTTVKEITGTKSWICRSCGKGGLLQFLHLVKKEGGA